MIDDRMDRGPQLLDRGPVAALTSGDSVRLTVVVSMLRNSMNAHSGGPCSFESPGGDFARCVEHVYTLVRDLGGNTVRLRGYCGQTVPIRCRFISELPTKLPIKFKQ